MSIYNFVPNATITFASDAFVMEDTPIVVPTVRVEIDGVIVALRKFKLMH